MKSGVLRAVLVSTLVLLGLLGSSADSGAAGPLAPGLSKAEHTALVHAGAFGAHPVRLLLLGDSITLTLGIGLSSQSRTDYGVTISNHASLGCDLDPDLSIMTLGVVGPATQGCYHWQGLWPYLTAAVHPNVVVLGVGRWEVSDHLFDGAWVHIGEAVWDDHVESDLRQAIAIFTLFGAKVVLFTMPLIDPVTRQADGQPFAENTPQRTEAYNRLVYQVARADSGSVSVIDLNRLLNPKGVYTPTVDGVNTRMVDGVHVTIAGGEFLRQSILPVIDRVGLAAEKAARLKAAAKAARLKAGRHRSKTGS